VPVIFLYIGQFQLLYRVRFLSLLLPPPRSISPLLLATLVSISSLRDPAIKTLLRLRVDEMDATNFPDFASYPDTFREEDSVGSVALFRVGDNFALEMVQ